MIAVGWSQDLSPGRATIVRTLLERSPVPVALLSLRIEHDRVLQGAVG